MTVVRRKDGTTGYVELDNPPVNAIGLALRQALLAAVDWAEAEKLERVILSGKGRLFAAGGDAKEFDQPPEAPHLPDVLNRIEKSTVPWIAAAHGAALGGGLELMLACTYRIVAPGTKLGLPEVSLGIVPGAGGTQRLPRLVGLKEALTMIPTGRSITAAQAMTIGLVDEIAEDPLSQAELLNGERLATRVPLGDLPAPDLDEASVAAARQTAETRLRGQAAPLRAIALIEAATRLPFDEGLAAERAAFLELRQADQARALRHLFFAERAAGTRVFLSDVKAPQVSRIAVVGGGTMGAGIAYALLSAGLRVVLLESDAQGIVRAEDNVGKLIEAGLKRGVISPAKAEALRQALTVTSDYAAAGQAELAIEAAFESMAVKTAVFAKLEAALPDSAILASNTSYLDIDAIAATLGDPARVLGLHFFAPAHIMKLLEIVRAAATSDRALAVGFDLAKRLKKVPVLAGVCDGFIGNRILARYREVADGLVMDGAMPWDVDRAMVAFGYVMGPYEAQDLSGLDIAYANRRRQDATRDPARRYIPIADRMVDAGRLGRKAGAGWYRYDDDGKKAVDPEVEALVLKEAGLAGVARRTYRCEDIQHRLLLAMIDEAASILQEGIATSTADIDLVTVYGYGFPRWRGGLMHYADQLGPKDILQGLRALAQADPLIWRPSPLIEDCAEAGRSFSDWRR